MAGGKRQKRMAISLARLAFGLLIGGCLIKAGFAADLIYPPNPPPGVLRRQARRAYHPRRHCRVVLQPRTNLAGEVVRFRPSLVCVSRGLYADTHAPPPPTPRPWWWLPWWRAPEP